MTPNNVVDLNNERIQDLKQGFDKTKEISKEKLKGLKALYKKSIYKK